MIRVLDLFSGIGGFSLGLERAGMQTVAFCEINPFCRRVLRKHWPEVPIHEDIRALDGRTVSADVICGGFPCQPFSFAGNRRGAADDRHLWPEMRRVIAECRPAWVVGENVVGIIRMELDTVLSDLESLGYSGRTFVIPAAAVDAPHIRKRIWVVARDTNCNRESVGAVHDETLRMQGDVAHAFGIRSAARTQGKDGAEPLHDGVWIGSGSESGRALVELGVGGNGNAANPNGARLEGRSAPLGIRTQCAATGSACRWPPEPGVGRVAHGVPHRVDRLRALGNAVVPQITEMIGRAIMRGMV